jgi:putative endonuclease
MNSKQLGALGEKIAEEYLKNKGYKILDKNYTFKLKSGLKIGEIDIVAKERDSICFIEVKTLAGSNPFFSPESKIDYFKKRKIIKTAEK